MNEIDCTMWFTIGLAVGIAMPALAKTILSRFGSRTENPIEGPKNVTVVLPGEALHRVADTVSATLLNAIESHIADWRKPSPN